MAMKSSNQHSGIFKDKEILILEDDLLLGKRISAFLEKSGAEITHGQSLEEARIVLTDLSFMLHSLT
jgi:DNA-binding response OmpR family regulator